MKRIEAIIQPHKLSKVVTALHALPHFPGFTVLDAHGQGHGRGKGGIFAYDNKEGLLYHRRSVLFVLCEAEFAEAIVATIKAAAHTGRAGDGLISVVDVDTVVRIGNPEGRE
jgi:nitrogen regulatory protein P-II 1